MYSISKEHLSSGQVAVNSVTGCRLFSGPQPRQGLVVNSTLSPLVERIQPMEGNDGFEPPYNHKLLRGQSACTSPQFPRSLIASCLQTNSPYVYYSNRLFDLSSSHLMVVATIRFQFIKPSLVEFLHTFGNNHLELSLICSWLCIVSSFEQSQTSQD